MIELERVWGDDENINEQEGVNRGVIISNILYNKAIRYNTILDICCGRGFVLKGLNRFDCKTAIGVDMVSYDTWDKYPDLIFIKDTFQHMCETFYGKFDVAVMLETWRRWDMLNDNGLEWRTALVVWLKSRVKYFICSGELFEFESYKHEIIATDILELKGQEGHPIYLVTL